MGVVRAGDLGGDWLGDGVGIFWVAFRLG